MIKVINGKLDVSFIDDDKNERLFTEEYVNELIKKYKDKVKTLENENITLKLKIKLCERELKNLRETFEVFRKEI